MGCVPRAGARRPRANGWATATPSLPLLAPALGRLLEELPASRDGLSTTERTALRALAEGAPTPAAAFVAAQELEQAPFLGDTWFFRALAELGRGSRRLVETRDGEELPLPPPLGDGRLFAGAPVRLTRDGERALAGEADRVELLGVDRWVGGTHISRMRSGAGTPPHSGWWRLDAQGTSTSFVASPAA